MQCVRCSHPLPPRADRCLRCFALNPQNHQPVAISFESDPPVKDTLGEMSIRSEPPAPRNQPPPARIKLRTEPGTVVFTPLEDPEFAFDDPGLAGPPKRVIDLNAPKTEIAVAQGFAKTTPQPKTSPIAKTTPRRPISVAEAISHLDADALPGGSEPVFTPDPRAPRPELPSTEPDLLPAPLVHLPPGALERAQESIDELSQAAFMMNLPKIARREAAPATASDPVGSDLAGVRHPDDAIIDERPHSGARLIAWALDGAAIALLLAIFIGLAAMQLGMRKLAPLGGQSWESWVDGLLFAHRLPIFWALLGAMIAVGYSWIFASLGGRTPGLRVAGLQLLREDGTPLDPLQALLRAVLALPSAALGLFGFVLAFVDPRGQTLHDKLSHSMLVVSGPLRRRSL